MSKAKTLATTVSTGNVLADGTVAYSEVSGTPTLATVATSGAYADVTGTPTLATVATSGSYTDLTGTPTLATVATSGSYTDLTDKPTITDTATNIAGGSAGTIPYQTAADTTAMLAAGTAGQVLQTNGAGAPTWSTPSSGAMVFVGETTLSGTSVSTAIDNATYSAYRFYLFGVSTTISGGAQNNLFVRFNNSTSTSSYFFRVNTLRNSYSSYSADNTNLIYLITDNYIGSSGVYSDNIIIDIFNIKSNSQSRYNISGLTAVVTCPTSGATTYVNGGFNNAITSMQFGNQNGSTFVGKMRIYGIV
jgi:hypothetical protein